MSLGVRTLRMNIVLASCMCYDKMHVFLTSYFVNYDSFAGRESGLVEGDS